MPSMLAGVVFAAVLGFLLGVFTVYAFWSYAQRKDRGAYFINGFLNSVALCCPEIRVREREYGEVVTVDVREVGNALRSALVQAEWEDRALS